MGFLEAIDACLVCDQFINKYSWSDHKCSQSTRVSWISARVVMTKGPYWKTVWFRGSPATYKPINICSANTIIHSDNSPEYIPHPLLLLQYWHQFDPLLLTERGCEMSHSVSFRHRPKLSPSRLNIKWVLSLHAQISLLTIDEGSPANSYIESERLHHRTQSIRTYEYPERSILCSWKWCENTNNHREVWQVTQHHDFYRWLLWFEQVHQHLQGEQLVSYMQPM